MSFGRADGKLWFRALIGFVCSAVVALVLLLILAGVATFAGANKTAVKAFAVAINVIAAGAAAYVIADGKRALLNGVISGIVAFLGVFVVFLIFGGLKSFSDYLLDFLFTVVFALIFSIIFVNFKKAHDNC